MIKIALLVLLAFVIMQSCKQSASNISILEYYANDSSENGESFAAFYHSILRSYNPDSIYNRIDFPFKTSEILNSERDWKTTVYQNLADFRKADSSGRFRDKIYLISDNFDFRKIFAVKSRANQHLQINFTDKNKHSLQIGFINQKGIWFINSIYELPVFEDGTVPFEE